MSAAGTGATAAVVGGVAALVSVGVELAGAVVVTTDCLRTGIDSVFLSTTYIGVSYANSTPCWPFGDIGGDGLRSASRLYAGVLLASALEALGEVLGEDEAVD